ncbi:MAG: DHH family phosphoesterase [Erysipelotrichaceae bacterium]|jgi:c-di-AMP phosphodiesterase-like protein|nr:DHH family phosphoesterase [Erysipelotrichaceae bacterium]
MQRKKRFPHILSVIFMILNLFAVIFIAIYYLLSNYSSVVLFEQEYIIYLVFFFIIFDVIGYSAVFLMLYHNNKRNAIRLADVIGMSKNNALRFAKTSFIVTDDKNSIVWISEDLKPLLSGYYYRNINNLFEINRLESKDASGILSRVLIEDRIFDIKVDLQAHLYFLKDLTDYYNLEEIFTKQTPVCGLLSIDNYNDALEQDERSSLVLLKIRNEIDEYFKQYRTLITRTRPDLYYLTLDREHFEKIKQDSFSLVDRVKELSQNEEFSITISLAFSYDFPDYIKLSENAFKTIEIAKERGGDQIVTSRFGSDLEFYGGRTNLHGTNSKVNVHVIADAIINQIKQSNNVIICSHTDTDLDAVGSSLGLKAIADHVGIPTNIVYELKSCEKHAKKAIISTFSKAEMQRIFISSSEALQRTKENTLLIITDVQVPELLIEPKLIEKTQRIIVIDHHRRGQSSIESPILAYIEPSRSSCVEMVTELIEYSSLNPSVQIMPRIATLMLSGLFLDTNYFRQKELGQRTFEVATILKRHGANNVQADDFLKDDFDEYRLISEAIRRASFLHRGILIASLENEGSIDRTIISKIADRLVSLSDVDASFVIGQTRPNAISISARSNEKINVQSIMEKIGGGGHFSSAATQLDSADFDEANRRLNTAIGEYLGEERTLKSRREK